MEDTLEKRILKSNLSDDDKIEIIKRLSSNKEYIYVPQPTCPQLIGTPSNPWYTNQPYYYTTAISGPYLSNSSLRS